MVVNGTDSHSMAQLSFFVVFTPLFTQSALIFLSLFQRSDLAIFWLAACKVVSLQTYKENKDRGQY